jgi:PIN domain nuclease of toxin-antitoxin system
MIRLLLDTHVFLWSLLEPHRLHRDVAQELERQDNEIWLSPITVWEVMILAEKGRIQLDNTPEAWVESVLATIPFKQAQLTHEVAMKSRTINLGHQDPADRFLAATAWAYDLTLVTADGNLLAAASQFAVLSAC